MPIDAPSAGADRQKQLLISLHCRLLLALCTAPVLVLSLSDFGIECPMH